MNFETMKGIMGIRGRNNGEHWLEVQNRIIGKKISIIGSTLVGVKGGEQESKRLG